MAIVKHREESYVPLLHIVPIDMSDATSEYSAVAVWYPSDISTQFQSTHFSKMIDKDSYILRHYTLIIYYISQLKFRKLHNWIPFEYLRYLLVLFGCLSSKYFSDAVRKFLLLYDYFNVLIYHEIDKRICFQKHEWTFWFIEMLFRCNMQIFLLLLFILLRYRCLMYIEILFNRELCAQKPRIFTP